MWLKKVEVSHGVRLHREASYTGRYVVQGGEIICAQMQDSRKIKILSLSQDYLHLCFLL